MLGFGGESSSPSLRADATAPEDGLKQMVRKKSGDFPRAETLLGILMLAPLGIINIENTMPLIVIMPKILNRVHRAQAFPSPNCFLPEV